MGSKSVSQGLVKFFYIGPNRNYFRFCEIYTVSVADSSVFILHPLKILKPTGEIWPIGNPDFGVIRQWR